MSGLMSKERMSKASIFGARGGAVSLYDVKEPLIPLQRTGYAMCNQANSTGLGFLIDPVAGVIIETIEYDDVSQYIRICDAYTLANIKSLTVSSQYGQSGNTVYNTEPIAYVPGTPNKVYVNGYLAQNPTWMNTSIFCFNADTGALIKTIQGSCADYIIKRTADGVIYYGKYPGKIDKLTFATDTVTTLINPGDYGMPGSGVGNPSYVVLPYNAVFGLLIYSSGAQHTLRFTLDGAFIAHLTTSLLGAFKHCVYHPASGSLIGVDIGVPGGLLWKKIDATTGTVISSQVMTASGYPEGDPNIGYFDPLLNIWLNTLYDPDGMPYTFAFKIDSNGLPLRWDFTDNQADWLRNSKNIKTIPNTALVFQGQYKDKIYLRDRVTTDLATPSLYLANLTINLI